MALTTVRPPNFDTNQGDYSYQDPATGLTYYGTYSDASALPANGAADPAAVGTGAITTAQGGGGGSGLGGLVDSVAYGNTQNFELQKKQVEAAIADAQERLKLAQNADQRAAAFLELQKWTAERDRILAVQKQYSDTAIALLNAATQLRGPANYFQYNQATSGGRDIFDQLAGGQPRADFSAMQGRATPASVTDILAAIGMPTAPQTTPLGGTPGAPGAAPSAAGAPSQAQADQVADGLGIDRSFIREYVGETGKLPDLPSLNDWMNRKGYRDPSGRMTGKMPGGQQATRAAAGTGGGVAAAGAGGSAAVAAPPVAAPVAPPINGPNEQAAFSRWVNAQLTGIDDEATKEMMRRWYLNGGRNGPLDINNQPADSAGESANNSGLLGY